MQKVPPSFSAPWHRFLKGLGKYNSNFIPNDTSINRSFYKYPRKSSMEMNIMYIKKGVQLKKGLFLSSSELVFN